MNKKKSIFTLIVVTLLATACEQKGSIEKTISKQIQVSSIISFEDSASFNQEKTGDTKRKCCKAPSRFISKF